MTFDTLHLAILFDLVQGIMLASQGKVLSPGNEGSMGQINSQGVAYQIRASEAPGKSMDRG